MGRRRISTGGVLAVVALLSLLAFAVWGVATGLRATGDTSISLHGYIALGLGIVFTLGLGGGLMWLAYYSARRGYDDEQR